MGQLSDGMAALIRYANETTGESDTTLSDAVESLVAGYGGSKPLPVTEYEWVLNYESYYNFIQTHIPLRKYTIEVKFQFYQQGQNDVYPFGADVLNDSGKGCELAWYSGQWWVGSQNGWAQYNGTYPYDAPTVIRMDASVGATYQDGNLLGNWTPNAIAGNRAISLFCVNRYDRQADHHCRMYFFHIKFFNPDTGELLHHIVPGTYNDGSVMMDGVYDKVDNVFLPTYQWNDYAAKGPAI